jgi:predicted GH43/DUF377 family glycosyl hydrolase
VPFLTNTSWGNPHVESGPPPLRLSSGDYFFLINSWNDRNVYQPSWVILSGDDPTVVVQRAASPLWSPQKYDWMTGKAPASCNVENVAFVEAAHPTEVPDKFRVYFGGADAVIGTAVVEVRQSPETSRSLSKGISEKRPSDYRVISGMDSVYI